MAPEPGELRRAPNTSPKEVIRLKLTVQDTLCWMPRILGLLFAGFLSLFALDVFGMGAGIWETIGALLIHLLPAGLLLATVALAWRRPWVGGIGFLGFAAWYLIATRAQAPVATALALVGLPSLIGLLFLADWWYRVPDRRWLALARRH